MGELSPEAATRLLARWARRRAVSAGSDATAEVWDLDAGEPLHTLARPEAW